MSNVVTLNTTRTTNNEHILIKLNKTDKVYNPMQWIAQSNRYPKPHMQIHKSNKYS